LALPRNRVWNRLHHRNTTMSRVSSAKHTTSKPPAALHHIYITRSFSRTPHSNRTFRISGSFEGKINTVNYLGVSPMHTHKPAPRGQAVRSKSSPLRTRHCSCGLSTTILHAKMQLCNRGRINVSEHPQIMAFVAFRPALCRLQTASILSVACRFGIALKNSQKAYSYEIHASRLY
jgi:hypothetical protein